MAAAVAIAVSRLPISPSNPDTVDFEFRLPAVNSPPVSAADELFSNGKLIPLATPPPRLLESKSKSPIRSSGVDVSNSDQLVSSPRAPGCTRSWRDLLGLKKTKSDLNANPNAKLNLLTSPKFRSLKRLLLHHPKPESESDADFSSASASSSSRSSSSSDSIAISKNLAPVRMNRTMTEPVHPSRLVESPRMNASGKVVFVGLERSSSSPASGGNRPRARGMERSYSANVRVEPVINVPVCSGSVIGLLFSPQRKENETGSGRVAVGFGRSGSKGRSKKVVAGLRE